VGGGVHDSGEGGSSTKRALHLDRRSDSKGVVAETQKQRHQGSSITCSLKSMETREWKNRWLVLLSPDWNGPRLSGVRSYLSQRYRYVDASAASNGHTQGAVSNSIVHVGVGGGGGGRRSGSTHVVTFVVGSKAAKGFIKFWKWEYWVTTSWGGGGWHKDRAWGGYGMGRASHPRRS
jgi:hypothetical protein